ncbi:MAG: hypothetical protein LR015_06090 [Verrucomicrobia bacterium]|nr:hypothetical protein [Verrucomicrobiota bacterium]
MLQGDITDDVDEWQGRVNNTIQELSQQSPIAGIRKDESAVAASDWMSAVNILMHKEPGFSYQEASPLTRPALMEACRLQFKNPKAVLWIGHTANPASGCFLISNISGGFAFDRWLAGSLQQLTASDLPISGQLRKAARQYTDDPISLSPSEWPVFGLRDASSLQLLKQWLRRYKVPVCVVLAILFLSVATGLLFAYALPERDNAVNVAAQVHGFAADPQQLADWQRYTRQYVDWILPLKTSVQLQSGQQLPHPVDDLLSTELNPFSVLGETSVRMDLVENPSNRVFLPANQQALSRIYGNQDNLSHAMTQLLSRMAVADSVVTVGSDPMIPIVFTSWKTEDFATIPEPGVGFDQNFLQWLELHEALKVVLQAQTYVRDSILVPLSGVSSAAAEWLQHEIGGRLANVPNPQAAMAVFDDLEGYLKSSDWNNLNRLTPEFDPAFVEWKSQQAGNLALDSFMALLSDFMLVEFEEVQPLLTRLPQRVATFDARLSAAQRDFPTLQWQNDEERFTVNQALAEVKRYGEQLPLTRQQMRQLHLSLEEGLRVLDGVEARFERQFLSLEDPVNWLNAIRLEFAGIESEQYRTAAIAFAERLVRHHANDESAELTSQFGRFIADARTVLTFFRPLTSHEYGHSNPDVQNYFSQPGAAQRFRAEFVRKVASFDLSLEPADLKSQLANYIRTCSGI